MNIRKALLLQLLLPAISHGAEYIHTVGDYTYTATPKGRSGCSSGHAPPN